MKRTRFNNCYYYVYITTNELNGKRYVGSRKTNKVHIKDDNYIGSGVLLLKAIKKHGRSNFTKIILETFPNQKKSFEAEKYYISKYNTMNPNGYNLSPTGGLGVSGCHSEETQKIINEKAKITKNTPEYKRKRRQIAKQLMENEEHRLKIKKGVLKYNLENKDKVKEQRKNQRDAMKSSKIRKKMSVIMKEYYKNTPGAREKNSKAVKEYYKTTPNSREKNSKAVKLAMNRPEVKLKRSINLKKRFENITFEEWSEHQKKILQNPITKEKMSNSAKKRIITRTCKQCNKIYYKKSINQFNKDLCDTCRKSKIK